MILLSFHLEAVNILIKNPGKFSQCLKKTEQSSTVFIKLQFTESHVKIIRSGFVPSCAAGLMVPPADSLWETIVTLILALLEALLGVGLGVCLLLP